MDYEDDNQAADAVLDSLETQESLESQDEETLNWAVQRIEEANLFKHLLVNPIFTNNSAALEIVNSVNNKIARFAMQELKELLGGKPQEKMQEEVKNQFSEDEVFALKTLASKVIEKTGTRPVAPEERTPTINSIDINNTRQIGTNQVSANIQNKIQTSINVPSKNSDSKKTINKNSNQPPKKPIKISMEGLSPEEQKKQKLIEKQLNRKVPKPPIPPLAQPVNDSWAVAHSRAGAQQAGQQMTSKTDLTSTIIGLELATPPSMSPTSGGDGVDSAIQFDPDRQ